MTSIINHPPESKTTPEHRANGGQWIMTADEVDFKQWKKESPCGTSWTMNIDHFQDGSYLEVTSLDAHRWCKLIMYPDGTFDTECNSGHQGIIIDPSMITKHVTQDGLPPYWKNIINTINV